MLGRKHRNSRVGMRRGCLFISDRNALVIVNLVLVLFRFVSLLYLLPVYKSGAALRPRLVGCILAAGPGSVACRHGGWMRVPFFFFFFWVSGVTRMLDRVYLQLNFKIATTCPYLCYVWEASEITISHVNIHQAVTA